MNPTNLKGEMMEEPLAPVIDFQRKLFEEHMKTMQRLKKGFEVHQDWKYEAFPTPHEVVYEEGKIRLLHYKPQAKPVTRIPLLIVFSLINRSYILDLKPGKSIVEKMVQAGFDVYLVDWGVPGPSDKFLTIDDYVNRYMDRIVDFIRDEADVEQISLMGYCMGGTMAGMYAALHPENINALILMAAAFDFKDKSGLLNLWSDKGNFDVDKLVDTMGNIPPWFLQSAFTLLKPMENMVDKYVKFFEKVENEAFVDDFLTMEYWLNDNIPMSGQVYRQFVKDCFQDNLLIQNKLKLGNQTVNLKNITCPVLSIVADHDHLVKPACSVPLHNEIGSKVHKVINFPSGHIGLSVGGKAMKELWPDVAKWLAQHSKTQ